MSVVVVAQVIDRSILVTSAPTATSLDDGFSAAMNGIRGAADTDTQWLAPRPRIVRWFETAALHANITSACNVAKVPNAGIATNLRLSLQARFGDAMDIQVIDWTPALNGPLTFWTSGEASITRTRDVFPELGGRADAFQNPIGPDSIASRPGTLVEGLNRLGEAAARAGAGVATAAALPLLTVALALGGAWFAWENRGEISRAMRVSKR